MFLEFTEVNSRNIIHVAMYQMVSSAFHIPANNANLVR